MDHVANTQTAQPHTQSPHPRLADTPDVHSMRIPQVMIEITSLCNLRCAYCYNDSSPSRKVNMDLSLIHRIIDEAAQIGCNEISISGGEPLLHPDVYNVLDYALRTGAVVTLLTNGTLLTDAVVTRLLELSPRQSLRIQVSLDGPDDNTNSLTRGPSYSKVINGIRLLAANGLADNTHIRVTLTRYNCSQITQLVDLASSLHVGISWGVLRPVGRGSHLPKAYFITPEDVLLAVRTIVLLKRQRPKDRIGPFDASYRCPVMANVECRPLISVSGEVFLCAVLYEDGLSVGNISTSRLTDVVCSSQEQQLTRRLREYISLAPECPRCAWRAMCSGGCPAMAIVRGYADHTDGECQVRRTLLREKLLAARNRVAG